MLLTIGLGHFEPEAAAREAAAAKAALGPWLQDIELGNEPNAYALHGLRSEPWTFVQYDAQIAAYRSAIEAAAPASRWPARMCRGRARSKAGGWARSWIRRLRC